MELQSDALNQMEYVMRRKKPKRQPDRSPAPDKHKISQMIWEYAGDFIRMGGTPEERQSLLNAACSAWNIACDPPERRKANLDRYMVEYRRYNTDADEAQMAGVRSNMEKLVEKKVEMFPTDLRQIVGARIVRSGDKDRIEVASATLPGR
jgi:hypothetical protein